MENGPFVERLEVNMGRKSTNKRKKAAQQAITSAEQAQYSSPSVDTVEAMNASEISNSLNPAKLAGLISSAKKGDSLALVTLALEMREEDASFGGNLRTRKLAIVKQPRTIAEGENEQAAELLQKFVQKRLFNKLLLYLLEAIEVGYAVVELVWGQDTEGYWLPVSAHRIDPRRIGYNPEKEQFYWRNFDDVDDKSKVIDVQGKDALRYVVYAPDDVLMPERGNLGRLAAYSFMAKRFGLNDWVSYLSSAGVPMRVGRYEANADAGQRLILKRALAALGHDKAAAIPKNCSIEFLEAKSHNGSGFKALAEYLDKQLAIAVLGQTLTSGAEGGGSYNLGMVHADVRHDILWGDCVSLNAEIQELADKICAVNFGAETAPKVGLKPKLQKDLQQLSTVVGNLSEKGLAIPKSWLYEEFGIPEPKDGEEVLGSKALKPMKDEPRHLDALNAIQPDEIDPESALDEINDAALEYDYQPLTELAILDALNSSRSFEQFQQKVAKIALQEPDKKLVAALTAAATKGALLGERDGDA